MPFVKPWHASICASSRNSLVGFADKRAVGLHSSALLSTRRWTSTRGSCSSESTSFQNPPFARVRIPALPATYLSSPERIFAAAAHTTTSYSRAFAAAMSSPIVAKTDEASTDRQSVAVVGAGIAGCLVAALLARQGCAVKVFDLGRGPGGRMSQRREKLVISEPEDASEKARDIEIRFDHGAPYFHLHDPVLRTLLLSELGLEQKIIRKWDDGGHGVWDASSQCWDEQGGADGERDSSIPLVAVPGANAICQHLLASSPLITAEFSVEVAEADWLETPVDAPSTAPHDSSSNSAAGSSKPSQWHLQSSTGKFLGTFHALAIAAAYRTMPTSLPDLPELEEIRSGLAGVTANPCFALMVAFKQPVRGVGRGSEDRKKDVCSVRVLNSAVIATLCRDSSKPGRQGDGPQETVDGITVRAGVECWVVHSTSAYATRVLKGQPAGRPSQQLMDGVVSDLWAEMQRLLIDMHTHPDSLLDGNAGGNKDHHHHRHHPPPSSPDGSSDPPAWSLPQPIFMKAHRWGGAFPANPVAPPGRPYLESEACRVVACGDFCTPVAAVAAAAAAHSGAPSGVEGAVQSAFGAAGRLSQLLGLPGAKL